MTTPFSTHAFMFPFKWDIINKAIQNNQLKEDIDFDQRTKLSDFEESLFKSNKDWERSSYGFSIKSAMDYNEYTYFYDFVRKVIYDYKDNANVQRNDIMRYYEHDIVAKNNTQASYNIHSPQKKYTLLLTGISLHIFNTGIGILTFNTENRDSSQQSANDILMINEFGRRIYPQFLVEKTVSADATSKAKEAFLATKISISLDGTSNKTFEEDFSSYNNLDQLDHSEIFNPPHFIKQLFNADIPNQPVFTFKKKITSENRIIYLSPLTDDRMFTVSWYGNDGLATMLGNLSKQDRLHESNWLYCYAFGDKEWPSIANQSLQKQHINEHIYKRWSEYGTVFGITRDTFVSVSSSIETLQKERAPNLSIHTKTMYYQMVLLCLAQRASILRFSGEVSNIADLSKSNPKDNKKIMTRVRNLYLNYIEFINKIYFREVTSQIQGIELYDMLQDKMRIERDVKNLDEEMGELHNLASLMENEANRESQEITQRKIETLTFVGGALLIPTLIISYYGMGVFDNDKGPFYINQEEYFWKIFISIALSLVCLLVTIWPFKKKHETSTFRKILTLFVWLTLILYSIFILLYPFLDQYFQSK